MTARDQQTLFGDAPATKMTIPAPPEPASDDQIQAIRVAFDSAGKHGMRERQQFIEGCLMRSVENIRSLTASEARRVLKTLSIPAAKSTGGSAWDDRDEETWIDKL
jgi:DNA polymerase-3 subunit epsilon